MALFRTRSSLAELRALETPVMVVYGCDSPDANARIAAAVAA